MKRLLALVLGVTMLMTACTSDPKTSDNATTPTNAPAVEGGASADPVNTNTEFIQIYGKEAESINYLNANTEVEMEVAANVIDNLIEYDIYGVVKPALATEWSVSDDGLVWTFKIREGVQWMTHEGKEYGATLKAQDFVDGMKWIADVKNASRNEGILEGVILNMREYFAGEITDFEQVGVKATDEYTLQYTLESPIPYFLSMVSYTAFMPVNGEFLAEQGSQFGTDNETLLYNGGYILSTFSPQAEHVYTKNEAYWDKDNVRITKITETYNKEQLTISPEMFLRGEISQAYINSNILGDWMNDPVKKEMVRPSRNGYYSYFYAFNFDPQFDEQYQPENWKVAVNNENFRKALFHAMDRASAMLTDEPYNPESRLINTLTPPNYVDIDGVDYTALPALADFAATDSFDADLALDFKAKAMEELSGKATFPVIALMPYNPDTVNWGKRAQLVEQQIETLLGTDFIDIVVEAGPATGFLGEVRRSGKFAFMECNWGPDYADPETYTEPFNENATYNKPQLAEGYTDADGTFTYWNLLNEAKTHTTNLDDRYKAFSEAEAFLIENAFIIPYAVNNSGYKASYLNPFEQPYSSFGVSYLKYKYQSMLAKPMSVDDYNAAFAVWQGERAAALAAAH